MRIAIYSGSFDIVTEGHLWMIKEGIRLFDKLIVGIGTNPSKKTLFDFKTRKRLLESVCVEFADKVVIEDFGNLALVQFARDKKAAYILRGIRSVSDFDYERMLKNINTDIDESIETVFLMPPRHLAEVSSSLVKGMLQINGWETIIKRYVPETMQYALIERFSCDPVELARYYAGDTSSVILAQRYSGAGRYYHNLQHLENCLQEFRAVEATLSDSYSVLMALLFHDIVYNPEARQPLANETASWELANQLCQFNEPAVTTIKNHILHTSHSYTGDKNADTDTVCDIDMTIFGYLEPEFYEYEANIRREYAFANDAQYTSGRLSFLQTLLASDAIFQTDYFNKKYEASARVNISRLINQLKDGSY
ncbi:MAG: pantetheine-phosphate adenylyltransferase [Methylococcales bacterium]|nr:pantetheine-phosphate adenylyltransferase [Methylococcales bacterium]